MRAIPALEALVERHDALGPALVRVRHDALLERRVREPGLGVVIAETHDRVARDRAGELGVARGRDVLGAGPAVRVALQRVVVAEGLVDVVEERGGLDEAAVDAHAPGLGTVREERRDLGDDGRVLHETRRRVRRPAAAGWPRNASGPASGRA